MLFIHNFLVPDCSTGIAEIQFKEDENLRNRYKRLKQKLSSTKSKLKKEYMNELMKNNNKLYIEIKDQWLKNRFNHKLELAGIRPNVSLEYLPSYHNYVYFMNKVKRIESDIKTKDLVIN